MNIDLYHGKTYVNTLSKSDAISLMVNDRIIHNGYTYEKHIDHAISTMSEMYIRIEAATRVWLCHILIGQGIEQRIEKFILESPEYEIAWEGLPARLKTPLSGTTPRSTILVYEVVKSRPIGVSAKSVSTQARVAEDMLHKAFNESFVHQLSKHTVNGYKVSFGPDNGGENIRVEVMHESQGRVVDLSIPVDMSSKLLDFMNYLVNLIDTTDGRDEN